jgi:hypothetical protein
LKRQTICKNLQIIGKIQTMTRRIGKRPPVKRSEFGHLLREYRLASKDPETNDLLTQECFAELLENHLGLRGITNTQISRWEKGGTKGKVIPQDKRKLLLGMISVLHHCGGITTLEQANDLLHAGDYRKLNEAEIQQINALWNRDSKAKDLIDGQSATIHDQTYSFSNQTVTAVPTLPISLLELFLFK